MTDSGSSSRLVAEALLAAETLVRERDEAQAALAEERERREAVGRDAEGN
jgi:hypothetical protein